MVICRDVLQFNPDSVKAKHVLIQHQMKVITGKDEEDLQPINIRIKQIFQDGMRASSFDVSSFWNKPKMRVVLGGSFFVT